MKHIALYGSIDSILERRDILLFAVYSALGFVFLENTIYLTNIGEHAGFGIFSARYFLPLLSHSCCIFLPHLYLLLVLSNIRAYRYASGFCFCTRAFWCCFCSYALQCFSDVWEIGHYFALYLYWDLFFTKVFLDERTKFYKLVDIATFA